MNNKFTTALQNFQQYCLGSKTPPMPLFEVATTKDLEDHTKELHALQSALRASGKVAKLTSVAGKYAAITYDGLTLRVQTPKVAKKTNVTATSIEAYKDPQNTTARATQKETVAAFILWKQKESGQTVCRNHVWEYHRDNISADSPLAQMSNASRSVNQIIKDGVILKGVAYRLEIKERKIHGDGNTPVEHFLLVKCEPAPVGEQKELFI